jgi:CRP-like cAMP-binding protein
MESEPGAFGSDSREDTQLRVRHSFERAHPARALIFDEGDPGGTIYIVKSGEVELTRSGPAGRSVVARFGAGEFFGEMSVALAGPRSVRATALTDCELIELDAGMLQTMCLERPDIALRIVERLAARVIELEGRLAALGLDELLRPLVRVLVKSAERKGDAPQVATSLRRLAQDAELTLLQAHRALHQLIERKLVRLSDDVLILCDLDGLSACLDAPA